MSDNIAVVRHIPWPYKAMLAICSDLDETPDAESYFGLMKFLNTEEQTPCGRGVNLEVGNSIYFDMPENQFSYWNTDDKGREKIRTLIKSGHIDCLHSFGDHAFTRKHAERALNDLQKHGCKMKVWVDHAVAPTNLGADIMQGYGDVKGHQAYHADLTSEFGIEYVWTGRVTSVIGQDRPFSLGGIADWSHPLRSADTLGREFSKHLLGKCGSVKYGMHAGNCLMRQVTLRNGLQKYEFIRCNPHWRGIGAYDRGDGIHNILTDHFMQQLTDRQGVCILYTHLGKVMGQSNGKFLPDKGAQAFKLLAEYCQNKKILVTTTSRLLDFVKMRNSVSVSLNNNGDKMVASINCAALKNKTNEISDSLAGLTVKTNRPIDKVLVNEHPVEISLNALDESGRTVIGFNWPLLCFPKF